MSTFKKNCGIPVDFEGFENSRCQDVFVFFDDFFSADFSASIDTSKWYYDLIDTQTTVPSLLDGTDEAADEMGGILNLVTDATADEGVVMQLNGEQFSLETGYPLYFETRINAGDVSNVDAFIGLCVSVSAGSDASIMSDGVTDRIGFELVAEALQAVAEKDSNDKTTLVGVTETDDTWYRLAFFYDGAKTVTFTCDKDDDGVFDFVTSYDIDTSTDYLPDNMMLSPVIEAVTGTTATAEKFYVDYILVMQQRYRS